MKNEEKDESWERIGRDLEQDLLGTRKLIYNLAKNYRKTVAPLSYAVKDKDREELLTDADEISERWRHYFENVLSVPNNVEQNEPEYNMEGNIETDEGPINTEEIETSLKRMKNGKAAGEDMILSEILKRSEKKVFNG